MTESHRAEIHGVPGERARAMGVMRAVGPLLVALFACGLFTGTRLPRMGTGVAGGGFLLAACVLVWAARDGLKGIEAFFKGARGEERVASLLAALPRGYHVFHDFGCCGGGIDHVVVGPTGLFVIETKCWSGEVTVEQGALLVGGRKPSRSPLAQVHSAVRAINGFLSDRIDDFPAAVPIICFASDTFRPDVLDAEGVLICNSSSLLAQLTAHSGHLSPDELERTVKVMEQKDA